MHGWAHKEIRCELDQYLVTSAAVPGRGRGCAELDAGGVNSSTRGQMWQDGVQPHQVGFKHL